MDHDISTAVASLGGVSRAASLLGVSAPAVHQWVTGLRPVPLERCLAIERATGGAFAVEQLRPDVRWHRVPDAAWPHAGGRPLIDVALPQQVVSEA